MEDLTPEEQFNQILGNAAIQISADQHQIDTLKNPGPAPALRPEGGPTPLQRDLGVERQRLQEHIYNVKADTIAKTDKLIDGMPKHVQSEMKQKVSNVLYPENARKPESLGRKKGFDESQERVMQIKADASRIKMEQNGAQPQKEGSSNVDNKDLGKEESKPPTRDSQDVNQPNQEKSDKGDQQSSKAGRENELDKEGNAKDAKYSMSTRFTQNLSYGQHQQESKDTKQQFKENNKDISAKQDTGKESIGSSSTRFTQSLSYSQHQQEDKSTKDQFKENAKDITGKGDGGPGNGSKPSMEPSRD